MTAPAGPVLRDIHLPPEPAWWPPAPGWWLVASIALLMMLWLAWKLRRRQRLVRARRALRREFERVLDVHPATTQATAQVAALSLLLRRATRRYAPQASTLRDEAWLDFLDAGDPQRPFSVGRGRVLLDGPYRPRIEAEEAEAVAPLVLERLERLVPVTHG
jgi:hypothetical protein